MQTTANPGPSTPTLAQLAGAPPGERPALLGSTAGGLSRGEVAKRLRRYGPNEPVREERTRLLASFLANFTHTLALLLWFAAGLSFAARIPELGVAIVAVVVINGVFAFVQEHRAEAVVTALMRRVAVHATVLRDGSSQRLPSPVLVPGDVVHLAAGDIVPADCVLLEADNLTLDLSMITGESAPVERSPVATDALATADPADVPSATPAGSAVTSGSGTALVYATGAASTLGRVAALVEAVQRGESQLERQVAELSRQIVVIATLAGVLTLTLAAASTETEFLAALTFGTGVIVALVPEGLLPTVSVSLAIGAARMAGRGAAIRRLSAVEVIGSATVICTDKTGTLTQNRLSVLGFAGVGGGAYAPREALLAAALCNDALDGVEGDPIDTALLRWLRAQGVDADAERRRSPRLADVPFDAHRRYMSVTVRAEDGSRDYIKGAPEAVLPLVGLDRPPGQIAEAIDAATSGAERVLLLASGPTGSTPEIIGLLRLSDPPRPEVPAAIASCRSAGIRVVMLTGDHADTARAVARAIGLSDGDLPVIEGHTADGLSDADLLRLLQGHAVFARTNPEQKLRIVSVLRRAGEVVAVTGDGINDAPALRAADAGIAMGLRGNEVAKQAADIVLADDNFATIVAAIEEGRSIKRNIRRFVSYVLTSNVAELLPFMLYIFLPVPLPLAIIQILAIDLGTDLLPALALGTEPPSGRAMMEPPEPPRRPLLTRRLAIETFPFFGAVEALFGIAAFFGFFLVEGWRPFDSLAPFEASAAGAATLTFIGIVAGQLGCLFAQRDGPLVARLSLSSNPWIAWGLLFEMVLCLALIYIPGLNGLFSMEPVAPLWLLVLPAGAAAFILLDLVRRTLAPESWASAGGEPPARRD